MMTHKRRFQGGFQHARGADPTATFRQKATAGGLAAEIRERARKENFSCLLALWKSSVKTAGYENEK
jgi:hypothetical protein